MEINTYLALNGRCDEAIAFYKEALGAEVAVALVFAYPSPSELAAVVDADLGRS